jgi:hypothetical protein
VLLDRVFRVGIRFAPNVTVNGRVREMRKPVSALRFFAYGRHLRLIVAGEITATHSLECLSTRDVRCYPEARWENCGDLRRVFGVGVIGSGIPIPNPCELRKQPRQRAGPKYRSKHTVCPVRMKPWGCVGTCCHVPIYVDRRAARFAM